MGPERRFRFRQDVFRRPSAGIPIRFGNIRASKKDLRVPLSSGNRLRLVDSPAPPIPDRSIRCWHGR